LPQAFVKPGQDLDTEPPFPREGSSSGLALSQLTQYLNFCLNPVVILLRAGHPPLTDDTRTEDKELTGKKRSGLHIVLPNFNPSLACRACGSGFIFQ